MVERCLNQKLVFALILSLVEVVYSATDPNDVRILNAFRKGLDNPFLLPWPENNGDPCGNPQWKYIICKKNRVSQIQVKDLSLSGPLPRDLNQLSMLESLGLQNNRFNGPLPSFNGLSKLRFAYLDNNEFDSIPADFFNGLDSLQVMALDRNNLNISTGWQFPPQLQNSKLLQNLTCMKCNLAGSLPSFLGKLSSLSVLKLSGNSLIGEIPTTFKGMSLQILWLNNQQGSGLTGPIDVVATMTSLTSLWLHGNHFSDPIPTNIGDLTLLKDLNLNANQLVGLVPDALGKMKLDYLDLSNNHLMGPIPNFASTKAIYSSNAFCQTTPGTPCSPQVMALLGFLAGLEYPFNLVTSWDSNNPCEGSWVGIKCDTNGQVTMINLPKFNLNGTLSPSVVNLSSLAEINLGANNLGGVIPSEWTNLKDLTLLDLSNNNISPPLPIFSGTVKVVIDGNPLINGNSKASGTASAQSNASNFLKSQGSKRLLVVIIAPIVSLVIAASILIPLYIYWKRKKVDRAPKSMVIHPRDPPDSDIVKIVVADSDKSISKMTGSGSDSKNGSGVKESHVTESGNLVISIQVLQNVTNNFSPENELGRGGFGVVYKGELNDGTTIAVKRMEVSMISSKALDEFQAEIAVLSKVRHRHLVSLLGYSSQGHERLLVYEYMPQGALSKHLFHWKRLKLEPLSWKRRLNIALDVARGMEYLHSLAQQSFIHRDLKSSNILLGDDFRAKVSDFGLVKLAPDGSKSVVTRLAGTFGYLAPEYAVTGKITTKVDVFSFGVVLMELLTGMMALDERRDEESQYLAAWFWHIKSNKEKLMSAIDPTIDMKEEKLESICEIAELAGHCTTRDPNQRPEMGHAVNVLSPLVEKWKPFNDNTTEYSGIDYSLPLNQMVKDWQESEGKDLSFMSLEDSKGSIPTRPTGFADSFTSADGR